MNDHQDLSIDTLLRRQFEGPVPDDGFSDRLMQQLPPRRRRRHWQLPTAIAIGLVASILSLSSAPLISQGWQDCIHGQFSVAAIITLLTVVGVSIAASWWALAESD